MRCAAPPGVRQARPRDDDPRRAWFSLGVTEDAVRVTRSVVLPLAEIELRFSRSSGPGGQHAQKSETRVEAVLDVDASSALTDAPLVPHTCLPRTASPGGGSGSTSSRSTRAAARIF